MDFGFSEEQDLLRESCHQFLSQEVPLLRARELGETGRYDRTLWRQIAELGWTAITVPEAHGGAGMGLVDLLVLAEEHGRLCQPGPLLSTTLVATVLVQQGSEAQCAQWLPRIAEGECVATWAHYEPEGAWGADDVSLAAVRDDESLKLSGTKRLVADALDADLFLVSVRCPQGPALCLVPADTPGIQIEPHTTLDIARSFAEVRFEGVSVDTGLALLPKVGVEPLERALRLAVVLQCGESLGVAEALLDMTVEYAKGREQFGRPIGSFQAIRHKCADMRVELEGIRTFARYAALAVQDDFDDAAEAVHAAGSHVGDATAFISGEALQIHGGVGFTWEYDVHLYLRRAKTNQVLWGDPAWHNERIVRCFADA